MNNSFQKSFIFILLSLVLCQPVWSSPWSEKETYGQKIGGKAVFGLKNTLLGWTAIPTETIKYEYYLEGKKGWEGFCIGIAKSVIYTATGAIHLVTFPLPVDFPDMGEGVLHSSVKEQAARQEGLKTDAEKAAEQSILETAETASAQPA